MHITSRTLVGVQQILAEVKWHFKLTQLAQNVCQELKLNELSHCKIYTSHTVHIGNELTMYTGPCLHREF